VLLNEQVAFVSRSNLIFQVKPNCTVMANILTTTAMDAPIKVATDYAVCGRNINDADAPCWADIGTTSASSAFVRVNDNSPTKARL